MTSTTMAQTQGRNYYIKSLLNCKLGIEAQDRQRIDLEPFQLYGENGELTKNSFPVKIFACGSVTVLPGDKFMLVDKPSDSAIACLSISPGPENPGIENQPGLPPEGLRYMAVRPYTPCPSQ